MILPTYRTINASNAHLLKHENMHQQTKFALENV
jgi:hypothetical protein